MRNTVGKTNYTSVLHTEMSKLETSNRSILPSLERSGDMYLSEGKDNIIGFHISQSKLVGPKIRGSSKREKLRALTSIIRNHYNVSNGELELSNTILEHNKSKTSDYVSQVSRPPRSASENYRPGHRLFRPYTSELVDLGAKKQAKRWEKDPGKLAQITAALSHLFKKQGNTDNLRRYFVKWGIEEGTSQLRIPEFVKRLELMGFKISESEAVELANLLSITSEVDKNHIIDDTKAGIPLKELAIAASMIDDSTFKFKLANCEDNQFIKQTILGLEHDREIKNKEKLFKYRFCKFRDQIYNLLKDEKELNAGAVFKKLAYLGFSEKVLTPEEKTTFMDRYINDSQQFEAKLFYDDMNEYNPNKKLQVC